MKTPNIHIAVYWGPRRETEDQCAAHVTSYYDQLRSVSPRLANWRPAGKPKPILDTQDKAVIRGLLLNGQNRRDIGGSVIPELGYSMMLWNGERGLTAQSRIQCGLFSNVGGMKNVCSLILSYSLARELGEIGLRRCLEYMVASWDPESGSVYVYVNRDGSASESTDTSTLFDYVRDTSRPRQGDAKVMQMQHGAIYRNAAALQEVLG